MNELIDPVQTSFVELTEEECLELLRTQEVGRLAVVDCGYPLVFPVNYALEGGAVIVRTDAGTKLAAARMDRVGFEVDHIHREMASGWSVLISGVAVELTPGSGEKYRHAVTVAAETWAPGEKGHVLKIVPVRTTGRLLTSGDDAQPR